MEDDLLRPEDGSAEPPDDSLAPDDPAEDDERGPDGVEGAEHLGLTPPG